MTVDLKSLAGVANPLQRHSKKDFVTLMLAVRCFTFGLSVPTTAEKTGMTPKSIRSLFLQLRERLLKNRFAKWHRANRRLLTASSAVIEEAAREAFFDALSQCYFNSNCYRNFRSGKRRARLCRTCPLPKCFSNDETLGGALEFIDTIKEFYNSIGIGVESDLPRAELIRRRAVHTATIAAAAAATRREKDGSYDYGDFSPLSFRTLLETLIADLADDPL